jgi:hypothetical protein
MWTWNVITGMPEQDAKTSQRKNGFYVVHLGSMEVSERKRMIRCRLISRLQRIGKELVDWVYVMVIISG